MPPLPPAAPVVTPAEVELEEFEALYRDLTLLNLPLPNSKKLILKKEAETEKANQAKYAQGAAKPAAPSAPK